MSHPSMMFAVLLLMISISDLCAQQQATYPIHKQAELDSVMRILDAKQRDAQQALRKARQQQSDPNGTAHLRVGDQERLLKESLEEIETTILAYHLDFQDWQALNNHRLKVEIMEELAPGQPKLAIVYANKAKLEYKLGRIDSAIVSIEQALVINLDVLGPEESRTQSLLTLAKDLYAHRVQQMDRNSTAEKARRDKARLEELKRMLY